jgi:6-phosphogluconolactonase
MKKGGAWGKHGFPHATERSPQASAEGGGDGEVAEASSGRAVSDVELVVVDDEKEAAAVVADRLVRAAREGGNIVLTGGKTPERAYQEAAKREPDWSRTSLWWGDERCVPPEHEYSNYGLAKRAFLDRVVRAPAAVHRIRGELGKEAAAADYDRELDEEMLDLILLGMGADGHVASLFPNAPTLRQQGRVLPAAAQLEPFVDRVTLSIPGLQAGRELLFLITGEAKAEAARRAFADEPSSDTPASLVRSEHGRTTAILDRPAAGKLYA